MTMKQKPFTLPWTILLVLGCYCCKFGQAQSTSQFCKAWCDDISIEVQLRLQTTCDCDASGAVEKATCDECVYAIAGDDNNRYCFLYSYEEKFDPIDPFVEDATQYKTCYQVTLQPGQSRQAGPVICVIDGPDSDGYSLTIDGQLCPRTRSSAINCAYNPYVYDCSGIIPFANSVNLCNGDGMSGYLQAWWEVEFGSASVFKGACGAAQGASNDDDGIGAGVIAGIIVAVLVVVGGVTIGFIFLMKRRGPQGGENNSKPGATGDASTTGLPTSVIAGNAYPGTSSVVSGNTQPTVPSVYQPTPPPPPQVVASSQPTAVPGPASPADEFDRNHEMTYEVDI